MDEPFFGERFFYDPAFFVVCVFLEDGVDVFPFFGVYFARPDALRVGTGYADSAELFEAVAVAAVEELVLFPAGS